MADESVNSRDGGTVTVRQVIVDRDGVLNREPADGWLRHPDEWAWEAGAEQALAAFRAAGLRVSVVTNQSGIGRGIVPRGDVERVHRHMIAEATRCGGEIGDVFLCPHTPGEECGCRKPAPGLVREALRAGGAAPHEAVLIGDDARDLLAGLAAGTRVALVRTGKGRRTEASWQGPSIPVFDNLAAAAVWILDDLAAAAETTP